MDFLTFLLVLFSIIWICTLILTSNSRARKSSRLPPGPKPFPIIGNILALGSKPHQSLAKLSQKYGPIMSLKLGSRTTVVVSSPEIAKIVLQKHDLAFSSRTVPSAGQTLNHHKFSMLWLPVEHQWRKLRKICKEQMFSVPRLDANQGLRKEKLQKLVDYVKQCSDTGRAVGIGEAAFTTSLNLISATLFSMEFAKFYSESSQEMKELVWGVMKCLGSPNFADYFPILKSVDPQGILKETKIYFEKLFANFDRIIDEKIKSREGEKHDLVEALIEINQRDEAELSREDIKHLLLDLLVAGSNTTSGTVEWAIAELIQNPDKLLKTRNELRNFVGQSRIIQESDIPHLPYLQAVVKETFRLHPIAPLLGPRKARTDVEINGYIIPKNAFVLINVWASGRDSSVWKNAESFMPERFLDHNATQIDFSGQDFESLAIRMVHLMLATLVQDFGWELEGGKKGGELDMDEKFGFTVLKAEPLKAVPIKL
ncbi:Cytochrome P450 CYP2 subfamily [Handroanthus impetiginosus]|uniref:Cytochrome P450 CYP2 subfamily n=1 Tax=Handroanthus impetiginosus TaxID=429701 RepID=A0A2G9FXM5_9LAMI|nr:Cytochrome P450 CYP2 subfamily [Handroanthus impetiginosus]